MSTNSRVKVTRESIAEIERQQNKLLRRNIQICLELLPKVISAKDFEAMQTPADCLRKCDMFLNALTKGSNLVGEKRNDALNLAAVALIYAAKL